MLVCHCYAVNERQIEKAVEEGAETLRDLQKELKVGTCCGRCLHQTRRVLERELLTIQEPSTATAA